MRSVRWAVSCSSAVAVADFAGRDGSALGGGLGRYGWHGQGRHYEVWAVLFVVADNDLLYHVALVAVGADITSYVDQSDVVVIIEIKDKFGG